MRSDSRQRLALLKELIDSPRDGVWLDDARIETGTDGLEVLRVRGDYQRRLLEQEYAEQLRCVLGPGIRVEARPRNGTRPAAVPATGTRVHELLGGNRGHTALRVVRQFCTDKSGSDAQGPLVVLCGPPGSGKSLLARFACELAGRRAFELDLDAVRRGRSRMLEPRKPLVVADGVDRLAGAPGGQRTLIRILDLLRDRGQRALVTVRGTTCGAQLDAGLDPGLVNRLRGGVWIGLDRPEAAPVRSALRERASRWGRRLDPRWEDELVLFPRDEALRALEAGLRGLVPACGADECGCGDPGPVVVRMKDLAAELLGVQRDILDRPCRKRSSVEARRVVMAAAVRRGYAEAKVASLFGLRGVRPVREAVRVIGREESRNRGFADLVAKVARVAPGT